MIFMNKNTGGIIIVNKVTDLLSDKPYLRVENYKDFCVFTEEFFWPILSEQFEYIGLL